MANEKEATVKKVIKNLRTYLENNLTIEQGFIKGLQGKDLLNETDASHFCATLSSGGNDALYRFLDHVSSFYVEETLERFCTFLDDFSKEKIRPRLGEIATNIRAEMKKHQPGTLEQADTQQVLVSTVRATQGETTPTTSTTEERSQDKIKKIVDMYRSGDYDVRVPEIPELGHDFRDLMVKLDHLLASADPEMMRTIRSNVRMEYRTYIYGWKPVELPAVPETPSGLYDFIAAKSTPYEVPLVSCAVKVLNVGTLTKIFQAYKTKLADRLRGKLHSCKMRNVQLPKRKDCTHLAAVVSRDKDLVLISLVLHIKEYLMEYLQLEETMFEGFGEGCTVLFFSIHTIDAVLLAPKILSHSAELKRMFDITHLIVFDYFACDLERATIELSVTSQRSEAVLQIKDLKEEMLCQFEQLQTSKATSQRSEPVLQIKDLKEEMLHQFEQLQTSKVNEDAMKYQHLQNKAISLKMKLKEEEMLRKKAEEEQRRIAGELVKMEKKWSESGSKSNVILKNTISDVERLLEQSSDSEPVEGLQSKIRTLVEEWSKISEHEDFSQSAKILQIKDLEEEMLRQFEQLKTFEENEFSRLKEAQENEREQLTLKYQEEVKELKDQLKKQDESLRAEIEKCSSVEWEMEQLYEEKEQLEKCIQELQGENQMLEAQIEGTRQDLVQTSRVVQEEEEEIRVTRLHDVSIYRQSSLYKKAFQEGAKTLYLATYLMLKNNAEETTYRIYVSYSSLTWNMILKAVHKEAIEFKEGQPFQFMKPPSGKLVCEMEQTIGNGWAVAIFGCPELRETDVCYEQYGFNTVKELECAVKEGLYPPNLTLTVVNNVSREEHATPKYVNCTIQGADRPLQFPINVWERKDPSSPSSQTPSMYNNKPSDTALNGILKISPDWTSWIVHLGVPLDEAVTFKSKPMGGLLALQYWRDGKSGEHFPPTWKFLLDTMNEAKGCEVAQKISKKVEQNEALWCAL